MTRWESSAWPLACGAASVFALSVILHRLPWQAAFGVVAVVLVVWAWQGSLVAGAALGGIAWMCVTGFDVHSYGGIEVTQGADAVRAVVLVSAGLTAAAIHAVLEAVRSHRRADPVWADFRTGRPARGHVLETYDRTAFRLAGEVPWQRQAPRTPIRPTEETSDG